MLIASWNVNSVKARLPLLLRWLKEARPDIALLQEIKVQTGDFPELEIGDLGYNVAAVGQKTYNGVAILARRPIEVEHRALPGDDEDTAARYVEAVVDGLRVASIYLPNGNPADSDKYPYKLLWMERLRRHAARLMKLDEAFVLGGDYNVAPTDADVYDPVAWRSDALCRPETRAKYRALVHLGLSDAFRLRHPDEPHRYTFWDYQGGRWQRDEGLRIDHLLLSPHAADRLEDCDIDRTPRDWDRASDHTPIWCRLKD